MTKQLLLAMLLAFVLLNAVDAAVARRSLLAQTSLLTVATAPLNALTHLGTPPWLRRRLSASPVLRPTPALFPHVAAVRHAYPIIRQEALAAMLAAKPIMHEQFFQGIADAGWKRLYIKWYGPVDPLARALCPRTCALVESLPEVHLAMFSILGPRSRIKPHSGPTRMCLRYHLGVQTPNNDACFINVGGKQYSWRDGQDVMFDDTATHWVENNTDQARVVLFMDVERPQEGLLKHVTRAMIRYGGPLTTRANDAQERADQA